MKPGWISARWWEITVAVLLLVTAVSRLVFRSRVPFNWDAVQYVLALRQFDIAAHQPQPPGNPLYILLGRGFHRIIADPNAALVALSIVASVLAVWGTAVLGARLAGRVIGLWAAILIAVNPLFWFYGETALSYAPEAAVGVLVALAAWRGFRSPNWRSAVVLGLTLAVAGGLRPTVIPLLGPLWLFGLARMRWRDQAAAFGATVTGCLAWAMPLVVISGGLGAYWTQLQRLTIAAVEPTSLLEGPSPRWLRNLASLLGATVVALNVFGVLVFMAARWRACPRADLARRVFLWAWIIPPLGMFSLVHFGQWGYLLLILPPATLLGLLEIERVWPLRTRAGAARAAAATFASALLFLGVPWLPINGAVFQPTLAAIRAHDAAWKRATDLITTLPPDQTVILTSAEGLESFRIAEYLFPQYKVIGLGRDWQGNWGSMYAAERGWSTYRLDPRRRASASVRISDAAYFVLFDASLVKKVPDPAFWTRFTLNDGSPLLIRTAAAPTAYVSLQDGKIRVVPSTAFEGVPPDVRNQDGRGVTR